MGVFAGKALFEITVGRLGTNFTTISTSFKETSFELTMVITSLPITFSDTIFPMMKF